MYSADLLPFVLPLDTAPDFRDIREYIITNYNNASYAENVKAYKIYNMLNAQIYLHNEIDLLSPDILLDQLVLKLMYHPRFPDVFFNFIANTVDDIPILKKDEVEFFLEGNYGKNLQQPDCDYLSTILTLWSASNTVLYPLKVRIALDWLEQKGYQLPPWPLLSNDLSILGAEHSINHSTPTIIALEDLASINSDLSVNIDERTLFVNPDFKWSEVDKLAEILKITVNRRFIKNAREQGILIGFVHALKDLYIVNNNLSLKDLKAEFGRRYSISLTAEEGSKRRDKYYALTKEYLLKHFFKTK